jgi:chemotaxis protein MotB
MGKWLLGFVVVLAAAVAALYWWVYRPQQLAREAAERQLATAQAEAFALRTRVADLESSRDPRRKTSTELQQQVAAKEGELAALHSTQDELVEGLKQEIADRQVQVERIKDKLKVDMVDEILFDSGEATIKPGGLAVLAKVGAALKKVTDRPIEVQGHTDNVPIKGALAQRFATNWELSAARALNVARFLQDTAGLDPTRLSATAYSEYHPRGSNDSEEGRRQNRRIEILLGPVLAPEEQQPPATP